ncbi:hypervirulence associated TUDOR domain-containing protein [Spirosoma jeollabukense]
MATVKKGDDVTWNYGKGKAEGKVSEVHENDIEKTVQGATVKRKGSAKEPALVIKQGSKKIVKSASEVTKK